MFETVLHDDYHLYCPECEDVFPIEASKQFYRHNILCICSLHCPHCGNNRFGIEMRKENFYK